VTDVIGIFAGRQPVGGRGGGGPVAREAVVPQRGGVAVVLVQRVLVLAYGQPERPCGRGGGDVIGKDRAAAVVKQAA